MKNPILLILIVGLVCTKLTSQISGSNYSYTVLQNDFGLNQCKGVLELNENLLLFDNNKIALYDDNYSIVSSRMLLSDQTIEAISIYDNLVYCAIIQEGQYTIKTYDNVLNEVDSKKLDFLFSDFEKTSTGYFFYNNKLNETNNATLFFTDNNFVRTNVFFNSTPEDRNLIIAPTSKMVRKDLASIYFNLPGTGEIYDLHEDGEHSLVYNMGTSPSNLTGNEEMNMTTISNLAKDASILIYAINDNYLIFFSQKNGNFTYFYDRNNKILHSDPAVIQYEQMDKFDFTSTCPSTFLKRKNKFAALLKGRDIHMIKEMITPSSKTDHIPNCNENDIVLMTFDVQ